MKSEYSIFGNFLCHLKERFFFPFEVILVWTDVCLKLPLPVLHKQTSVKVLAY